MTEIAIAGLPSTRTPLVTSSEPTLAMPTLLSCNAQSGPDCNTSLLNSLGKFSVELVTTGTLNPALSIEPDGRLTFWFCRAWTTSVAAVERAAKLMRSRSIRIA